MKFRKVVLFFMIVSFGMIIEGISVTRSVMEDGNFLSLPDLEIDGDFPFAGLARFRGPSTEFVDTQTTDASGVAGVEVSNEFGDVIVRRTTGSGGEIEVSLRKEVFTRRSESAEAVSDKVKLVLNREGNLIKISTTRDVKADYRVRTHLEISTPTPLDTRITNRHGKIVVEGAKAVNVSGEFDEMRLADVSGECSAKNRHGNLEVISAALGCRVEVEYGDAHVEKLMAPSRVEVSHGNLSALDLAALSANLRFADMQARTIAGDLMSDGEHSDLRIDDVKGEVTLNNQGDIDLQNVGGRISIDNQRGHVRLLKAAAGVLVKNTYDTVAASDIGGLLEIINKHGGIRVQRFLKGANLETDNEDVDARDFAGPLKITANRGDVSIKPLRKVGPIEVSVDIGDIDLGLPDSVSAQLDASVERGEVEGNVGALKSTERGKKMLRATIGEGGALLKLRSRLGDITVSSEDDMEVSEPNFPDAPDVDVRFRPQAVPFATPLHHPEIPEPPAPPEPPRTVKPAGSKIPAPPEPPPAPTPEGR